MQWIIVGTRQPMELFVLMALSIVADILITDLVATQGYRIRVTLILAVVLFQTIYVTRIKHHT